MRLIRTLDRKKDLLAFAIYFEKDEGLCRRSNVTLERGKSKNVQI